MVILIDDMQIHLFDLLERMRGKLLNGLLGEEQLDLVSLDELLRAIAFFPIQRDVLLAHHLIEKSLTGQI